MNSIHQLPACGLQSLSCSLVLEYVPVDLVVTIHIISMSFSLSLKSTETEKFLLLCIHITVTWPWKGQKLTKLASRVDRLDGVERPHDPLLDHHCESTPRCISCSCSASPCTYANISVALHSLWNHTYGESYSTSKILNPSDISCSASRCCRGRGAHMDVSTYICCISPKD